MNHSIKKLISLLVEQALSEIIPEPKRKGLTTDELGIVPGAGYQNIMNVLRSATPSEIDYWTRWYTHAKSDVIELAREFNVKFSVMAAIVAVLSPGNKWHMNIMAARRLLENATKINAYGKNIEKARKILVTEDIGYVTGPKVTVFFDSLIDPATVEQHIVLDGHAINLWRGIKRGLKGTPQPTKQERNRMLEDYQKAAKDFGITPQGCQALTWYIWKYTTDPPKSIGMRINLLPKS